MTIGYGLGMLGVSMVALAIGATIAYLIIKKL